jgi:orotidine-5'-phosphate decarboxylase
MTATRPQLIVALDVEGLDSALALVNRLSGLDVIYKIGHEALFGYGDAILGALGAAGAQIFVDAKLHDIPRTVAAGVRALVRPGVRIINVHALGGAEMMEAAVQAAHERARELRLETPEIYAVTILTSISAADLGELGLGGGLGENVIRLAALARDARCAGVVCSVHEAADLKSYFGAEFGALCPGIRPGSEAHDDQKRVATPAQAARAGADYIVVGRPITQAADPRAAAERILNETLQAQYGR